jgi:hypothetical protein
MISVSPLLVTAAFAVGMMVVGHRRVKQRVLPGIFTGAASSVISAAVNHDVILAVFEFLGCCAVVFAAEAAFLALHRRRWLHDSLNAILLAPPFRGTWRVVAAGPRPSENHHIFTSDQRFAADFVRVDEPSAGSEILAPADSTVRHVVDDYPDEPAARMAEVKKNPFGNYVALEIADDVFVLLCHLERGSISVRPNERVSSGTLVGRCGNSGWSRGPHLHLHAQNSPFAAPDRAVAVPVRFADAAFPDVGQLVHGR